MTFADMNGLNIDKKLAGSSETFHTTLGNFTVFLRAKASLYYTPNI